jgi:hypothetical protein
MPASIGHEILPACKGVTWAQVFSLVLLIFVSALLALLVLRTPLARSGLLVYHGVSHEQA